MKSLEGPSSSQTINSPYEGRALFRKTSQIHPLFVWVGGTWSFCGQIISFHVTDLLRHIMVTQRMRQGDRGNNALYVYKQAKHRALLDARYAGIVRLSAQD